MTTKRSIDRQIYTEIDIHIDDVAKLFSVNLKGIDADKNIDLSKLFNRYDDTFFDWRARASEDIGKSHD